MTVLAAVQMRAGPDKADNLDRAERLVELAAERGARVVVLPEMFNAYGRPAAILAAAEPPEGPTFERMRDWSRRFGFELLAGSWLIRGSSPERGRNRLVLFGAGGQAIEDYVKLHLFEIDAKEDRVFETDYQEAGERVVVAATPLGAVGLSICYDLRFPELYRRMAEAGCDLILAPSAFLDRTGRDHWSPLTRARAIENQCYLIAANQWGAPEPGLPQSYGHSIIVGPWGDVLAEAPGEGDAVITADFDPASIAAVRRRLPALRHRRL